MGGKFFGCISGGAPLELEVAEFFERIGIKVYQGYGLSETSPVVSVNTDKRNNLASVGHPLRHFEARIDSASGELLLRGPSVMKGYHNQPELTAEVIDTDKPSSVEDAVPAKWPSSPNKKKNTALGGILGMLLAISIILVRYYSDMSIRSEDDVKKYVTEKFIEYRGFSQDIKEKCGFERTQEQKDRRTRLLKQWE